MENLKIKSFKSWLYMILQKDCLSYHLDSLKKLQIPFLLLGPWGKDLHEGTERVHIDSVSRKLPHILDAIISYVGRE